MHNIVGLLSRKNNFTYWKVRKTNLTILGKETNKLSAWILVSLKLLTDAGQKARSEASRQNLSKMIFGAKLRFASFASLRFFFAKKKAKDAKRSIASRM